MSAIRRPKRWQRAAANRIKVVGIVPSPIEEAWSDDVDADLAGLLLDRRRLLKQLTTVLRRVGASHPERSIVNKRRTVSRKAIRKALRLNADAIAARTLELDDARH